MNSNESNCFALCFGFHLKLAQYQQQEIKTYWSIYIYITHAPLSCIYFISGQFGLPFRGDFDNLWKPFLSASTDGTLYILRGAHKTSPYGVSKLPVLKLQSIKSGSPRISICNADWWFSSQISVFSPSLTDPLQIKYEGKKKKFSIYNHINLAMII